MSFFLFLIKFYMIILLFRLVLTKQELTFNPIGKVVATLTNPVFKFFKIKNDQENKLIFALIILGVVLSAILGFLFTKEGLILSFFRYILDFLRFFMVFFIVCVILGNFVNKSTMSAYVTYFFRLGMPWIKFTRTFIPLSSGNIIYPTMAVIFLVYLLVAFGVMFITMLYSGIGTGEQGDIIRYILIFPFKSGLLALTSLFSYAGWLMIIRALMSWVNPDLHNPFVQFLYTLTDPILSFFRRFIPSIGVFDFSVLAAIVTLNLAGMILQRFISMI